MLQLNDNYCITIVLHIQLLIVAGESSPLSLKFEALNRHQFCFFIIIIHRLDLKIRGKLYGAFFPFFFFLGREIKSFLLSLSLQGNIQKQPKKTKRTKQWYALLHRNDFNYWYYMLEIKCIFLQSSYSRFVLILENDIIRRPNGWICIT